MTGQKNSPDSMTVIGHLEELRGRILSCLAWLACGTAAGFCFAGRAIKLLEAPASGVIETLVFTKPVEGVSVYIKVALYCGFLLSSPFISWHVYSYLKPALGQRAKVTVMGWFAAVVSLFALGTLFAYSAVLPFAVKFLVNFSEGLASPMVTIDSYISFVLAMMLLSGAVFEMPVLSALLTELGILTPSLMREKRKEAVFGLVVVSAVATPTTDVFNMLLFLVPMVLLYEASILVSSMIIKLSGARSARSARSAPGCYAGECAAGNENCAEKEL